MFNEYSQWFKTLQGEICDTIEDLEVDAEMFIPSLKVSPKEGWTQKHKVIYGDCFEKGTVNFSKIESEFDPKFAGEIPGTEEHNRYSATGISVVLHPWNPHAPAMHFNTRYIKTSTKEWFGGGMDVTPCMPFNTESYHTKIQNICDYYNPEYYPKFSKACDEYFYLPHRNETRGVGGIFFEYYDPSDMSFDFVKDVGRTFNDLIKSIITPTLDMQYSQADRETLDIKRGRYAEFNLLYDRGTRFGFKTGGNTDAILMSMPPSARWT
jgi:coproporphyrinogen III oxidase